MSSTCRNMLQKAVRCIQASRLAQVDALREVAGFGRSSGAGGNHFNHMGPVCACRRMRGAVLQMASLARQLSTTGAPPPGGELPSLKAALRAIYKRVHPDLFQDYQPAKDANTRSFKMLHEYMDAARTGSKLPLPYRFHFFIRSSSHGQDSASLSSSSSSSKNDSSSSSGSSSSSSSSGVASSSPGSRPQPAAAAGVPGAAAAAGSGVPHAASGIDVPAAAGSGVPLGLREVVVTLPPPTRGAPGEALSASARKAFGSLLSALSLPSRFAGEAADDAGAPFSRFVSLREFLPQAVEAVNQNATAQNSSQHQLAAFRTALRLGRCLTVGFGGGAASAGAVTQLSLLQRLVGTLDALPSSLDLTGLRVTVGGQASGVDALGTVWLAEEGSQEAWRRHLASVDPAHCRNLQQLRVQVQAQERAVAAALGVSMIYTQPEASMAPGYRRALERLAAAAAGRGPVAGGRFKDLPVMLQPAVAAAEAEAAAGAGYGTSGSSSSSSSGSSSSSSGKGAELGGCTADSTAGLLVAPVDVSGDALYAAVQALGGQVLAAAGQRQRREAELAALRTQVERKVMLRRLLRDPAVSDAQFKSCLDRMLGNAQKLSGLLHGHAVRVAEVNALSPDKAVISIAWNWRL